MREAAVYEAGGQYHMEAVTVDANDPTLTPALQALLLKGLTQPWIEWRVISTNKKGESKTHLVFSTEPECDAAMDDIRANVDAENALYREDSAQ